MFETFRYCATAFVLVSVLVIAGGCSSKPAFSPEQQAQADLTEYEAQLRKVITDPARADKLIALTNEFQKLLEDTVTHVSSYRAKAAALNSNYEAIRTDYEKLFSEQDAARETFMRKAISLREQMAALTTDEEWAQLKKARLRALDADLQELL